MAARTPRRWKEGCYWLQAKSTAFLFGLFSHITLKHSLYLVLPLTTIKHQKNKAIYYYKYCIMSSPSTINAELITRQGCSIFITINVRWIKKEKKVDAPIARFSTERVLAFRHNYFFLTLSVVLFKQHTLAFKSFMSLTYFCIEILYKQLPQITYWNALRTLLLQEKQWECVPSRRGGLGGTGFQTLLSSRK